MRFCAIEAIHHVASEARNNAKGYVYTYGGGGWDGKSILSGLSVPSNAENRANTRDLPKFILPMVDEIEQDYAWHTVPQCWHDFFFQFCSRLQT